MASDQNESTTFDKVNEKLKAKETRTTLTKKGWYYVEPGVGEF
jgi:hypothetical protein